MKLVAGNLSHLTGGNSARFGSAGVDKARFAFPLLSEPDWHSSNWTHRTQTGTQRRVSSATHLSGLTISARALDTGIWGTIEITPAYMLGASSNVETPNDELLGSLARLAFEVATELAGLEPSCRADEIRVTRLDLTRDVVLPPSVRASDVIAALSSHQAAYGRFNWLFRNGRTENETLFMGNNTRKVRVYDKLVESRNGDARGLIRWECQLRKGYLSRKGLRELADISTSKLDEIRRELWAWSGMDGDLQFDGSPIELLRRLVKEEKVTSSRLASLIGRSILGPSSVSDRTRQRDSALLRDLKISSSVALLREAIDVGKGLAHTIDFETGEIAPVSRP